MTSIEELQLLNFKSFRKAKIPIPKGLIAITGPNGSGKSNILDAIAFLMGWRARRLRASKMEQLVRRGAPWAQVSLRLNSGGSIKVSRKIKPNGTSVYEVNGKTVPANEALELLSSLGLVAEKYTFVTQGDITSIVEMSPQEKYRILEEMSGVSEYDEKREEALRELDEVDQLLREISAVMRERERELRRVEEELKLLRERGAVEWRIRRIRKYLILRELSELEKKLRDLEEPVSGEEIDVESLREELERKEIELRDLEDRVKESPVRRRGQLRVEIESLIRQRDALRKALEAKEEFLSSLTKSKEVTSLMREDPSFLGTVSELIRPLPGYEIPFLAVGFGRLSDAVVRDLEGAKRIAAKLRGREGRYRIIPLDVLSVREQTVMVGRGPLFNYLAFDPEYEALAKHLFSAILLDDLEEVGKELIGRARYVTMAGEVVEREGSIIAGAPERSLANFSKLVEEIKELREEISRIEDSISSLEREISGIPESDPYVERLEAVRREVQELRRKYQEAIAKREAEFKRMKRLLEERSEIIARKKVLEENLMDLSDVEVLEVPNPKGELAALEVKLRTLGDVNPKAPEEYERRKREYEEVRENYERFMAKRNEIISLIERIDSERERVLMSTLNRLSSAFNDWIILLFEGGGGELYLSGRGLEIRVNLPGKGSFDMDSLSGGEKSLCALAFILASQRVKPSPLYIFDEADAMLDGLNCKRYARALRELAKSSNVIIISLKRETLEEADFIIGVTMRGGESKIITVERENFGNR